MMTEGPELRKKLNLQTEENKLEDRQANVVTQSLVIVCFRMFPQSLILIL